MLVVLCMLNEVYTSMNIGFDFVVVVLMNSVHVVYDQYFGHHAKKKCLHSLFITEAAQLPTQSPLPHHRHWCARQMCYAMKSCKLCQKESIVDSRHDYILIILHF